MPASSKPPVPPARAARGVCRILREAGHEAWFVGGSVRDHLLGVPMEALHEIDVATDARPDAVEALFRRTIATGKAFGVINVRMKGHWIEVATFRTEADYGDGRHPERVAFATAEEDVRRRDFTVNGLLLDPETGEVRDYVGGVEDLEARRIRAIGDPRERFAEDHLRLLRAARFGSVGEFRLAEETEGAMRELAPKILSVSAERLRDEFLKIATREGSRRGDAWRILVRTGLAGELLPECPLHSDAVERAAVVLERLRLRELPLFLAAITREAHASDVPARCWRETAEAIADRLRLAKEEREALVRFLVDRSRYRDLSRRSLARRRVVATRADAARHEDLLAAEGDAGAILELLAATRAVHGAELPSPLVDGRVLMKAGIPKGPGLGRALRRVRFLQLDGRIHDPEAAVAAARARA